MGNFASTRFEINDDDDLFDFLGRKSLFVLARVLDGVLPLATHFFSNDRAKMPSDLTTVLSPTNLGCPGSFLRSRLGSQNCSKIYNALNPKIGSSCSI